MEKFALNGNYDNGDDETDEVSHALTMLRGFLETLLAYLMAKC